MPGCIDTHCHFRDPGATAKEDFTTGTQAAIAGGVTTVFDMPNTNPSVLNEQDLLQKQIILLLKLLLIMVFGVFL